MIRHSSSLTRRILSTPSDTLLPLLADHPNLVIIRTLSKAFALAAIRVGFIVAAEEVLEQINKLIPPTPCQITARGLASMHCPIRALSTCGPAASGLLI